MIILFQWSTFLDFHQEAMLTDRISLARGSIQAFLNVRVVDN